MLYARFANDNGLDMVEAQRLLMGQEYRTWRMDIEDYIKEIQANGDNELLRELNTLAMRSRITRLDKLYADTLVEIGKLSKDVRAAMDKFLPSAYKDFYYHDLYDIGQKRGLIHPVSRVDAETLENVIRTPWSGKNYSARIWKNGEKLAETIQRTVTAGMHRGCSADELARYVKQRMNVGYSQAIRLVRTELNYVENRAIVDGIKESGMKYYRFVATLDRRTSATCRDHDGHIYPVDDYSPGTNAPPLHPHCRSTIVGSLKGDSKPKGTRAARDESGKYIRVPASMSYEEWKKVYVDKKITLREWKVANGNDIIKIGGERPAKEQDCLKIFSWSSPQRRSDAEKLAAVNPNYSNGRQWQINCQRCVVAEELQYRGYNVTAKPYNANDAIKDSGIASWKFKTNKWYQDPDVKVLPRNKTLFKREVAGLFAKWGDGSRAIIRVQWLKKYGGCGHFFFARNVEGRIVYTDPQINTIRDIDATLSKCTTQKGMLWIMRVDNRELSDVVSDAVEDMGV